MLKALGINKIKAPSDEQVAKHREQRNIRFQWETDVTRARNIVRKLESSYMAQKGTFALGRYEELKNMIKAALQDYAALMQEHQCRDDAKLAGVRSRGSGKGAISRLMLSSKSFADQNDQRRGDERDYSKCTAKDIDCELEQMRKDILEYKNVFRTERDKLERLALEYEASKKYNPTQRYGVLKSLIKSITKGSACPTPSQSGTSFK